MIFALLGCIAASVQDPGVLFLQRPGAPQGLYNLTPPPQPSKKVFTIAPTSIAVTRTVSLQLRRCNIWSPYPCSVP